jgi:LacI family transcriptional regulator
MMSRSVTLRDVADNAEVSIGTASRVLNGLPVDNTLTERVHRAAARLNYRLPRRRSGRPRIGQIGYLLTSSYQPDSADLMTAFWARILAGAEDQARRLGARIAYRTLRDGSVSVASQLDDLELDAILLVGSPTPEVLLDIAQLGLPLCVIDTGSPLRHVDAVNSDNFGGARLATERLLGAGHRAIGFVGGPLDRETLVSPVDSIQLRLLGYLTAIRAARIASAEQLVAGCALDPPAAAAAALALIEQHPEISALFVPNDTCAAGVIQALRRQGIDVPGQVSIIGFDDDIAVHTTPALTTIAVDKEAIGRIAVQRLVSRAEHPAEVATSVTVPVRLVERATVAGREESESPTLAGRTSGRPDLPSDTVHPADTVHRSQR